MSSCDESCKSDDSVDQKNKALNDRVKTIDKYRTKLIKLLKKQSKCKKYISPAQKKINDGHLELCKEKLTTAKDIAMGYIRDKSLGIKKRNIKMFDAQWIQDTRELSLFRQNDTDWIQAADGVIPDIQEDLFQNILGFKQAVNYIHESNKNGKSLNTEVKEDSQEKMKKTRVEQDDQPFSFKPNNFQVQNSQTQPRQQGLILDNQ